jgi:hypothetical protein
MCSGTMRRLDGDVQVHSKRIYEMLINLVPAANPAVGYWQWVISIKHVPETRGFPIRTITFCCEGLDSQ